MTVVLSMNPLCTPHHKLCGGDDVLTTPDLSFNFVTSPPRADTPIPTEHQSDSKSNTTDKSVDVTSAEVSSECAEVRGMKRKVDSSDSDNETVIPCKRMSPYLNTPKQRKDERRKVLRISIQKLREMEDPEHFLRRSVLINNTVKKVQTEIREEKKSSSLAKGYPLYKRKNGYDCEVLNNSYLSSASFDEPLTPADDICDDDTDALVRSLENDHYSDNPLDNFSTDLQREKQIYADMDTVFNNLIRALGET